MHVVFCQNRTSDMRIIGSYNGVFPLQKTFMQWLQKAVIKRRAEGSQMSGIVLLQWLEVIFSHICFTSECQNDINFDWCQCAPFVNLLVCCCGRKCWKEDFFFLNKILKYLYLTLKFMVLYFRQFCCFFEFGLPKDDKVKDISVNSVFSQSGSYLLFYWIDVHQLENFKYNIPASAHDGKACQKCS